MSNLTPPGSTAIPGTLISPGISSESDAEILRLGVILDHFIKREQEAWALVPDDAEDDDPTSIRASKASDDTFVVVKEIAGLQACTIEGLLIKARSVQMCRGDIGPVEVNDLIFSGRPSLVETLMATITRDLVAMSLSREAMVRCPRPG